MRKLNTPSITWRAIPIVRLLLPFLFGIYLGEAIDFYPNEALWLLCGLLSMLYCLSIYSFDFKYRWIPGIFINLLFMGMGYCCNFQQEVNTAATHFSKLLAEENSLIGIVTNYPKPGEAFIKVKLKTRGIKDKQANFISCTGNILIYLKDTLRTSTVHYGDQILLMGNIHEVSPPKNPFALDYQRYLYFQHIHHQAFIDEGSWAVLSKRQASFIFQKAYACQKQFLQILQTYLKNPTAFAIASAMTLGDRTTMDDDTTTAYVESGVIHVLAVSGLHVGIISEMLLLLFGFFDIRKTHWKWLKGGACLFFIWTYVLLVGASDSAVRAALMFSFINIGRLWRKDIHPFNSLAAAAFFILAVEPYALFQVGFQFSFLAMAGIFFFYRNIYRFWIPTSRYIDFFWKTTAVGISAQLMVMPLSAYYFHQLPSYSLLSGLFIGPLAVVILYLSIIILVVHFISPTIATFIGSGLSSIIELQNKLIFLLNHLPFHKLDGIWLSRWEVVLLYGAIIGLLLVFYTKRVAWLICSFASIIVLLIANIWQLPKQWTQQKLVVYAIPKATLIDFVEGAHIYSWEFSDTISEKAITYAARNFRWATGVQEQTIINKKKGDFESKILFIKENYLQFANKTMVIIDPTIDLDFQATQPFKCNYVLLRGNPKLDLQELSKRFQFDLLIFDQSNTFRTTATWKKDSEKYGLPYYDIGEKGAYVAIIN